MLQAGVVLQLVTATDSQAMQNLGVQLQSEGCGIFQ